jgi:hypothetical protein
MSSALGAFLMLMISQIPSHVDHIEYVRRVTFIGSPSSTADKDLRNASSSIEEGKIYTPKALMVAIGRINKLSLFHTVTQGDCRVTRSSIYPDRVDIEIRLKLKARTSSRSDTPVNNLHNSRHPF